MSPSIICTIEEEEEEEGEEDSDGSELNEPSINWDADRKLERTS